VATRLRPVADRVVARPVRDHVAPGEQTFRVKPDGVTIEDSYDVTSDIDGEALERWTWRFTAVRE
jgi:hypothetical protein